MWINPFLAGVACTVVCEVVGLLVAVGVSYHKAGKL